MKKKRPVKTHLCSSSAGCDMYLNCAINHPAWPSPETGGRANRAFELLIDGSMVKVKSKKYNMQSAGTERPAWEELYRNEGPIIMNYIARRVGCERAADILQECFLNAMSMKKFPENPKAYLFQIARNLAFRSSDNRVKELTVIEHPEWIQGRENIEKNLVQKELFLLLAKAVATLNSREEEIFDYRFNYGLSTVDIAGILGRSQRQIRRRLAIITKKIKKFFSDHGWEAPDVA